MFMSGMLIEGGNSLNGTIKLQGAKNSALPILSAALLCSTPCTIHNCPRISDVEVSIRILESLGCKCNFTNNSLVVDSTNTTGWSVSDSLMSEMRSSVIFLGAMLAKTGKAELSAPGGCELGLRPINLHIDALKKMGAFICEEHGRLICSSPDGLKGCTVDLPIASVGATENIMIAASTAEGTTIIHNAAKEPEICDLANFLRDCGAKIKGDGETVITIEGVKKLSGCEHRVIPDRIVAATYISALAVCGGKLELADAEPKHLHAVIPYFEQLGCKINSNNTRIIIESTGKLKGNIRVRTTEYPGFPTDAQPVLVAAAAFSRGTSVFVENIFSNRFRYVSELNKMGAAIEVYDRVAVVHGVNKLNSANVEATDLRGGAAMVICALAADGVSRISALEHIDRGYENIEGILTQIGANIVRER